jgi:hypothetical protein
MVISTVLERDKLRKSNDIQTQLEISCYQLLTFWHKKLVLHWDLH